MKLKNRIAALEKGLVTEPTLLTMPDGKTVHLTGRGDQLVRLLGVVFEEASPEQEAQLNLIRCSTDSREWGGGHMVDLIRALLLSPLDEGV